MKALNRAFDEAFAHSNDGDNISKLLACLGQELGCERVSIFEENDQGSCDNTYEWCRPGVVREQILLQHVDIERFDTWHDRLMGGENIVVRSLSELEHHDPDVYAMFVDQDIHQALVALLAFHGKVFGFCILEDPSPEVMDDADLIMPGIRYVLSSMIYSHNLVARLRRIGYIDTLTGVGNRISLQEHLELLDRTRPVGVISADVIGWDDNAGKMAHLEREQTLLRAGEILTAHFGEEQVFRVATGEFVVVKSDCMQDTIEEDVRIVRGLFREHNLLCSISGVWTERLDMSIDDLIHEAHTQAADERRMLLTHRSHTTRRIEDLPHDERAAINLPRGDAFFRLADEFLSGLFEGNVLSIVVDINFFKLYNDIFGRKAGNVFLMSISDIVADATERYHGVCGYIGGDDFCLLIPTSTHDVGVLEGAVQDLYSLLEYPDGFAPAMGVYLSEDRRETMTTLYDRALSALAAIKGDYMRHINFYNPEDNRHQKEDKILLLDVKNGLAKGEFIFYVQPQVNERTGKIIGGEALVRWMREGQLVSPGVFIPMLEKTGYVYTVDTVVWEGVAAWLRDLIDRGIEPVPISVNVSRVDFYFDDIAQHFINLARKYRLEPTLIGIEITESAFTDNMDTILEAVARLHDAGFHILMDDFGSGSSSLSMLHTMNLDVLKTDVRFMSQKEQDNRAISIVESVISMAHMIGMSVVTEGVETEEQKNSLIALGDNFAQGFYFYRPMPKENFEQLIVDRNNVAAGAGYRRAEFNSDNQLHFRDMIREGLVSETLLDNILRAVAIFREQEGAISVVQMNQPFAAAMGVAPVDSEMEALAQRMEPADVERLRTLMAEADAHQLGGSEGMLGFTRSDGVHIELEARVFLLYSFDDHKLYLSTMG